MCVRAQDNYCMPGESLQQGSARFQQVGVDCNSPQPSSSAILDAIKEIKDGVDSKMTTIADKLDTMSDRLQQLETRQK